MAKDSELKNAGGLLITEIQMGSSKETGAIPKQHEAQKGITTACIAILYYGRDRSRQEHQGRITGGIFLSSGRIGWPDIRPNVEIFHSFGRIYGKHKRPELY